MGRKSKSVGKAAWVEAIQACGDWEKYQARHAELVRVHDAWGEFLNAWEWELFCTVTRKTPSGPHGVRAAALAMIREIARRAGCKAFWFLGYEPHQSGSWHGHMLVGGGVREIGRLAMNEWMAGRFGWARVFPVTESASFYVAKYAIKGLAAWEFSPNALAFKGVRQDGLVLNKTGQKVDARA